MKKMALVLLTIGMVISFIPVHVTAVPVMMVDGNQDGTITLLASSTSDFDLGRIDSGTGNFIAIAPGGGGGEATFNDTEVVEFALRNPSGSVFTDLFYTFTARAGDRLSFDWNFLTDEYTDLDPGGPDADFNDFAFVTIGPLTLLADTLVEFSPSSHELTGETGIHTFSYAIPSAGTHTLQIGIVDVGDEGALSKLSVERIWISGPLNP